MVSWTSCTSADCVVPAAEWTVVGTACGGSFVGQPPNLEVAGTERSITINANALGLLGDSVSFSVQGSLASGLAGDPRSDHACTEAWRPPTSAAITLGADGAVSGQTVTATLQVSTQGGQSVQAFGSKSTQFVYRIGPATLGPTTKARLTIPGLQAGRAYAASVQIYPTGHPRAVVTVSTTMRASDLSWPRLAPAVGQVSDNPPRDTVDLPVAFPGHPPGPLVANWTILCGNTSEQGANTPLTNGAFTARGFDLDTMGGACQITASVAYANPPGIANPYGNTSSQPETTPFSVGTQPTYGFSSAFSNECLHFCQQEQVVVSYDGSGQPAGDQWSVALQGPGRGHEVCAAYWPAPGATSSAPGFPVILNLPSGCTIEDPGSITIRVGYRYLGQAQTLAATSPSQGPGTTTTTTTTTTSTTSTTPRPPRPRPARPRRCPRAPRPPPRRPPPVPSRPPAPHHQESGHEQPRSVSPRWPRFRPAWTWRRPPRSWHPGRSLPSRTAGPGRPATPWCEPPSRSAPSPCLWHGARW